MKHGKPLERRTFLQDRFEILIQRQKSGKATFNELTELDEIVNRDPELREKVIREDILMEEPVDFDEPPAANESATQLVKPKNIITLLKESLSKLFISRFKATRRGIFTSGASLALTIWAA